MHKRLALPLLCLILMVGCSQQRANENAEQTRDEAKAAGAEARQDAKEAGAEANEEAKQAGAEVRDEAREAGAKTRDAAAETRDRARAAGQDLERRTRDERAAIKEGAKDAAQKTAAAVGGFVEGWRQGDAPVDLNSASEQQLRSIGFTADEAQRILAARPFDSERDLVSRGIVSEQRFDDLDERFDIKRK